MRANLCHPHINTMAYKFTIAIKHKKVYSAYCVVRNSYIRSFDGKRIRVYKRSYVAGLNKRIKGLIIKILGVMNTIYVNYTYASLVVCIKYAWISLSTYANQKLS